MSESGRLAELMQLVVDGDAWHADSVATLLSDVTAAEAAAHPVAGAHSIWEIVLHATGWATEVRRRIGGKAAGMPDAGDWPAVGRPSGARWDAARAALLAAYADLERATRTLSAAELRRPVVDTRDRALGTGATRYVTLHGAIHHLTYHAGQIALLKRAMRA